MSRLAHSPCRDRRLVSGIGGTDDLPVQRVPFGAAEDHDERVPRNINVSLAPGAMPGTLPSTQAPAPAGRRYERARTPRRPAVLAVMPIGWQRACGTGRPVFVDKTWTKTNMAPLLGWAPKGHRLKGFAPHGRWHP